MAVKIYNKQILRNRKCSDVDPVSGISKMSDQLKTIQQEIKVWQRADHENVVKIFELYDDIQVPEMYLLMELCKYGQIQVNVKDQTSETITEYNPEVLSVAIKKGHLIWPHKLTNDIETACRWIFWQVAEGMRYLHDDVGIIHRDLKHENILMGTKLADPYSEDERQPTVKICDFTVAWSIPKNEESFKLC